MILILHDNDFTMLKFTRFLLEKNFPFIEIKLKSLFRSIKVNSTLSSINKQCKWYKNEDIINFSDIKGIYHNFYYPSKDHFLDFEDRDIEYTREEWHSYLLYELSQHNNCINPVDHSFFNVNNLNFIKIYKVCQDLTIEVPEHYIISPNNTESFDGYILKSSISEFSDYSDFNLSEFHSPIIAIKRYVGAQIFVFIIGNAIIARVRYKDCEEDYIIPNYLAEKLLALNKKLKTRVSEMFLIKTLENKYILYHVSEKPKWNLLNKQLDIVWDSLYKLLVM
ncbi:hypothetical protein MPCS_01959 (plasmid) [Candidatus Megaera polyxenophila]|nr:hypothetical protein MPCS_01959 [Candidatus Megaera polyxenophila]